MTGRVPSISAIAIGRRRAVVVAAACAAAAAILGASGLGARAHADPDPEHPAIDPKAQCESPDVGGVFVTDVKDGVAHGVCQYIVEGYFYYDTFENGTYLGTSVYRDGQTVPTERPVIPEVFAIPPNLPLGPFGPS